MTQQIGQYRILSELGAGGMGVVYRAVDLLLEREVAIKRLRSEYAASPSVLERFRKEAQLQAKLNHPNIAQLYTLLQDGDSLCIVMEFIDGTVLRNFMPMPWQSAAAGGAADSGGARLRPPPRRAAPRYQARKHRDRPRGHGQGDGFRHRPRPGSGPPDARAGGHRHPGIHAAGAHLEPRDGPAQRSVFGGRAAVRDALRPLAVCRRQRIRTAARPGGSRLRRRWASSSPEFPSLWRRQFAGRWRRTRPTAILRAATWPRYCAMARRPRASGCRRYRRCWRSNRIWERARMRRRSRACASASTG